MLNGLDLFSGIGGLTLALSPWVRPIAYCENDRHAQGVILSRIFKMQIPDAGIWDDVRTLKGSDLPNDIDIIYGGFPCQDISVAGNGAGLEGKRSGLVFEIFRLIDEIKPSFIFLENVPAIRTRGAERVAKELSSRGYDCRWHTLSAEEVGAPHKRERWFLLAYSNSSRELQQKRSEQSERRRVGNSSAKVADTNGIGSRKRRCGTEIRERFSNTFRNGWWNTEPDVGRVANGVPARVDRIRALGNAVVPLQARQAFKELMGIKEEK